MRERLYLAPGRPPTTLGLEHGLVVRSITLAVCAKERITRLAYWHAQGRLHAIRLDSPGVREAATAVLQRACDDPTLLEWLWSDRDEATMGTPAVQAVFDLLCAFSDEVSRVTVVCMPSGMDPLYPYGHVDTKASLPQALADQQALSWRARELWRRDADEAGLASKEATSLL